jgi:MSHA biogenesis protein MshI
MKFNLPWQKAPVKPGRIGIATAAANGAEVLAVACCDARGEIVFADQVAPAALVELVAAQGWTGMACSLVLPRQDYQLLLADAPDVPAAEVAAALRWRIKDLLSYPVQQAALAASPLPADAYRGRQKKAYVAALQTTLLEQRAAIIDAAGLNLDCIEIAEFALNNLQSRIEAPGAAILLHLFERGGLLNIVEAGQLYLSRESEQDLQVLLDEQEPFQHREELLLEVQRSRDFYESQMGKGIITRLQYSPDRVDMLPLADYLASQLGLVAEPLEIERVVPVNEKISLDTRAACTLAIGAALGVKPGEQAQTLNLAGQIARQEVQLFNLRQQLYATLTVALLVVVYGFLQIFFMQGDKARLAVQQAEYQQLQDSLAALVTQRNAMDADKTLDVEVAKLEKRQQFLDGVLRALRDPQSGSSGFSEQLMALSRQHQEGLWLTRIELSNGGRDMALTGKVTDPALLPQYIQRLSVEPVFAGQAFRVLRLASDNSAESKPEKTEKQSIGAMGFELRSGDAVPAADAASNVAARGNRQ